MSVVSVVLPTLAIHVSTPQTTRYYIAKDDSDGNDGAMPDSLVSFACAVVTTDSGREDKRNVELMDTDRLNLVHMSSPSVTFWQWSQDGDINDISHHTAGHRSGITTVPATAPQVPGLVRQNSISIQRHHSLVIPKQPILLVDSL